MKRLLGAAVFSLALLSSAFAVEPDEVMSDPALESRARALSSELRCLVCQNQSIDESHAPLARDLRIIVREKLKSGESEDQIRDFLVRRYGDFVLLKPPVKAETVLLWISPFLLVIGGGVVIFRAARRRSSHPVSALNAQERARLDAVLNDDTPTHG